MSLFRRAGNDSLTAFATDQITAATNAVSTASPGAGPVAAAAGAQAWASLAPGAVDLFTAVRRASTLGDLGPVSDRVGSQLRTALIHQQDTLAAQGRRRVTRIDHVDAQPFNGRLPDPGDRAMVVRYQVQGGLGEAALGTDLDAQLAVLPSRSWFEIWRLERPTDAPAVEPMSSCPNCGAPGNGLGACHYCGTNLLTSPTDFCVQSIEWLA